MTTNRNHPFLRALPLSQPGWLHRLPGAVAALLLLPAVFPAHALDFDDLPPADQEKLRAGEVVSWVDGERKKRFVSAAILLDVPFEQAWALIADKSATPKFIRGLLRARVLSRKNHVTRIEQETESPGRGTLTYVVQHTAQHPNQVAFERVGGDLRHIEGAWMFDQVNALPATITNSNNAESVASPGKAPDGPDAASAPRKTLLIYKLHVDPGRLLPQKWVCNSQLKKLPVIMTDIRDLLDAQTWPPPVPAPNPKADKGPALAAHGEEGTTSVISKPIPIHDPVPVFP